MIVDKVLVKVLDDDIADGCPRSASTCPVARATARATGMYIAVTPNYSTYNVDGKYRSVNNPRSVRRFIRRFDHNLPVKPFNFYFDPSTSREDI